MAWLYLLRLVGKNVGRNRLRTSLTMVGIAVAILSYGMLRTIVQSWYAGAEQSSAARLITRNDSSLAFPLPVSYATALRKVEGVSAVTWANWFGGIYIDEKHFFPQFAVDADTYFDVYPEYKIAPTALDVFRHQRRGAIVGAKIAREYGWKVGDQVPLKGTIYPGTWNFTITGIYTGADDKIDETQFIFHWDYLNETVKAVLPSKADNVGLYIINLQHAGDSALISAAIDSSFHNSLAATHTETQKAFQLGFVAMVDTILVAIQTVAYVVILIIMAVMANTMAMTARERTREYATLKALGFSPAFVLALIAGESVAIALIGGLIGILLTFPLASAFHAATGHLFAIFAVTPLTVLLQVAAAAFVGVMSAIAPAWSSSRLRIVDGLRAVS
jgi:putative ABC transport system permease protein